MTAIPLFFFVLAVACSLPPWLAPHHMRPVLRDCCAGVGLGALVLGYATGMALW